MSIPEKSFCERWFGCACACDCADDNPPPQPVQQIPRPATPSHPDGVDAANNLQRKLKKRQVKLASTDMTTLNSVIGMSEEQYRKYVSDRSPNAQQTQSATIEPLATSRRSKSKVDA